MLYRRSIAAGMLALAGLCFSHSSLAADSPSAPGLVGEYFQVKGLGGFTDVQGKTPFLVRVDKKIDFPEASGDFYKTKLATDFYAVWTGSLKVEKPGEYCSLPPPTMAFGFQLMAK